jgi:hypothetical protein
MVVTSVIRSSAAALRMSTPCSAPRPVATMMAVGVCQTHRARTGDDQHGDGVGERVDSEARGPEQPPADERERGDDEHDGHEHGGHAIGQALDGRARALRLLHQLDDAGQRGLAATRVARKTKLPARFTVPPNTVAPAPCRSAGSRR